MPSIKKPKYVDDTIADVEDNRTMEEIVRDVSLEEFLNCKETREILVTEAYWKFEAKTKHKLAKIYEDYNTAFGNDTIFTKDWKNELGDLIADIIYDHTSDNFDLNIFYACPELAEPVFK
uniref:Uncharacterized protein n=1 Tax=viral metagenome TaxID=1070528 RepID=A0A6C0KAR3_9ZZZZ|tara:strand:+ start:570 stop:929 length:360 start_codon:yes stop_codon:yes gene_type:complete